MATLDELKDRIREEAQEEPGRFFAVDAIRQRGFHRSTCEECGTTFWAVDPDREVCGEPDCSGGYTFINNPPTEKTFDVVSAWDAFSSFMEERGYEPIQSYPLAARWRDDTEVVRASIYDFQPYVVSGEVEPPANPLVVPQFCFRSNDIDNVGITGRHYTGFIMVGQHAFTDPTAYEQERYFTDMLDWVIEGMGIPKDEIILHEDAWGGGGNLGACMEFFVRGLELFNQVYMFYAVDSDTEKGYRELDTKVLDMGMGHERVVWITHGSETSYEANMPEVVEKLYDRTDVEPDPDIWSRFLPYSGHLNLDEVDDIEETWTYIADQVGEDVDTLKEEILPAAALYAIADHTRTLLVALHDGLLPSNAGERHALRVMVRRCFDFIEQYGWDIDLNEVLDWHADEFGGLYPKLRENLDDLKRIVDHERAKYEQMQEEAERILADIDEVDVDTLVELYDSSGITPDMLERHGIDVEVPQDFYKRVAERHGEDVQEAAEDETIAVGDVPKTQKLYMKDEYMQEFTGTVLAVVEHEDGVYVVLDRTAFYPTGGGQEHDTGELDGVPVVDVVNQDGVILHELQGEAPDEGDEVGGVVDWERRTRLRKHHTATHCINAAAREVLGGHVWQAGSHKSERKARLDITHYDTLTRKQLEKIEEEANRIVEEDLAVEREVLGRREAEDRYGFRIYQGGAVPGNRIRVIKLGDADVEACGGTHVERTGEIGTIRVINTKKVQDGTIRLEYVAGPVAEEHEQKRERIREQIGAYIDVDRSLEAVADVFDVEIDHLPRVVERFVDEWEERWDDLHELAADRSDEQLDAADVDMDRYDGPPRDPQQLFEEWKQLEKDVDTLESRMEDALTETLLAQEETFIEKEVDTEDVGLLIRIARHVAHEDPVKAVVLKGENAVVGARGRKNNKAMDEVVAEHANVVQGDEAFAKGFDLKR